MSHEALSVLVAAIGGFLLGFDWPARRDRKRLDWLLSRVKLRWGFLALPPISLTVTSTDGPVLMRDDIDAAMAAEAAHDAH